MLKDKILFLIALTACLPLCGLHFGGFFIRIFYVVGFFFFSFYFNQKILISLPVKILILFTFYIIFNFLVAGFFVDDNLLILSPSENITYFDDLNLSKYANYSNFTQLFYPFFWLFFTCLFPTYLAKDNRIFIFYKYILFFYLLVSLCGYLYLIYPVFFEKLFYIFLNYHDEGYFSNQPWGNGFLGFPRMASLVGEPSNILLLTLFISGPLILALFKGYYFGKNIFYKFILLTIFINLILIQSTSVFIASLFLLFIIFCNYKKIVKSGSKLTYTYILFFILLIVFYGNSFYEKAFHFANSGIIRYELNIYTLKIIAENFLFGIGFGTHRSTSLILFITVSLGIFGLFIWLLFIYSLLIKYKFHSERYLDFYNGLRASFFITTLITFISFSESLFVLPYYWLNAILLISLQIKSKKLPN